jgi:hypothetical protein
VAGVNQSINQSIKQVQVLRTRSVVMLRLALVVTKAIVWRCAVRRITDFVKNASRLAKEYVTLRQRLPAD